MSSTIGFIIISVLVITAIGSLSVGLLARHFQWSSKALWALASLAVGVMWAAWTSLARPVEHPRIAEAVIVALSLLIAPPIAQIMARHN